MGFDEDSEENESEYSQEVDIEAQYYRSTYTNPNTGRENQILNCRLCGK